MQSPRTPLLPPLIQQQINAELRPNEKLIWAAQPVPRLFSMQNIGIVIFGIPWTAFAIFWMAAATWGTRKSHAPGPFIFFPLFGLPFVLIGFGMLSSPFWMWKAARRTVYAITGERAIIFKGNLFRSITIDSFLPERLTSMSRTQRGDGTGDLIFEQYSQRRGNGSVNVRRGFIGVENVRDVEELINRTLLVNRAGFLPRN